MCSYGRTQRPTVKKDPAKDDPIRIRGSLLSRALARVVCLSQATNMACLFQATTFSGATGVSRSAQGFSVAPR